MGLRYVRSPLSSQPQWHGAVNYSHPLADGLTVLYVPTMGPRNLVGNSNKFTGSGQQATQGGIARAFTQEVLTPTDDPAAFSSDFSFVSAFVTNAVGGVLRECLIARGATSGSATTGFGMHAFHTNAAYSGAVYCGSAYNIIGKPTGGALASNTRYVIGAGVAGAAGAVYLNGIQTASVGSGLSARGTTGRLALGTNSDLSDTFAAAPAFEYYAQWNRRLTDAEQAIAGSPQFWQLLIRRIFVPVAAAGGGVSVAVPSASLSLTGFAPAVTASANQTVAVPVGSLTLTAFAPTVLQSQLVQVPAAALTLTAYAPTVNATANQWVNPPAAALTLTGFAPSVLTSAGNVIQVPSAGLTLTGFVPTVSATANQFITVPRGQLTLTGRAPIVSNGEAPVARPPLFIPPLQLPKNVATIYDRELQQAIKAWADRTTKLINDLASRIP